MCLGVDRATGDDEGRDIGDRIVQSQPTCDMLQRERLVEVLRARRVERHQRDVGRVNATLTRPCAPSLRRLGQHLWRELPRHLQLRAQRAQVWVDVDPGEDRTTHQVPIQRNDNHNATVAATSTSGTVTTPSSVNSASLGTDDSELPRTRRHNNVASDPT